ncbi:hypothetical protein U1Q18_033328 [Sarracenia purpurea var. burkii]
MVAMVVPAFAAADMIAMVDLMTNRSKYAENDVWERISGGADAQERSLRLKNLIRPMTAFPTIANTEREQ